MGERQESRVPSRLGNVRPIFFASQTEILPRTILLFTTLDLVVAFLRSLVRLPGDISIGNQSFSLGASLPLYSIFAVTERAVALGAIYLLTAWLTRPGTRSGLEWLIGICAALPLLVELARLTDGTTSLLLLATVLRRWLTLPIVAGFVVVVLIMTTWMSTLQPGEWHLLGLSFSVTKASSLEQILTAGFLSVSYIGFILFALELSLRLSGERERLRQTLVDLEKARQQEQRLLVLEERASLSRELHDTIGHHMTALGLYSQHAELLAAQEGSSSALLESLAQVRSQGLQAMKGLTQAVSTLRDDDPTPAVSLFSQLTVLCQQWPAPVELSTVGQDRLLPYPMTLTAYRACQEALTNANKHAPGKKLHLKVEVQSDVLRIEAMNPLTTSFKASASGGYGLRGIQERALKQGGTLEISEEQGVFRWCLTLPLTPV